MYEFIDTTEVQKDTSLPAEAVKFNGIWLDGEIPGFRTLHVSGRELMECEITDEQMGCMDGTHYQYKRYPPRAITVTYQLLAESNRDFREAYNQLNGLLDAEQVELLFNDEPDKFFIATKASNSEVDAGRNCVTGEIYFYCTDPLKYSTVEKAFPASLNEDGILEATIINEGTESVPISYEIAHNHENGYIGIVSEHGVIQLGNIEEMDGEDVEKSQTLIDDNFITDAPDGWTQNDATVVKVVSEHKQIGSIARTASGYQAYQLKAGDYGSGSQWHGPSYKKKVPADGNGHVGAKNCTLSWHHFYTTGTIRDCGVIQFHMTDADNKNVAAVAYFKNNAGTNTGAIHMYVNGSVKKEITFDCSFYNNRTGKNAGRSSISKFGGRFEFNIAGYRFETTVPGMEDVEVAEISMYIGKWNTNVPISENSVYSVKFVSHSVTEWRDIPNRYQNGDTVTIDGEATKVYVNGMPRLDDEKKGTKYFKAPPGETKVQFAYSDFCDPAPGITAKIREAYL